METVDRAANPLDAYAIEFGTDKATEPTGRLRPKGYTVPYFRHFAAFRDRPIRLLEIGIAQGASLKMWEAFFPDAQITGIDIRPDCRAYANDRTAVYIGDQTDRRFLHRVIDEAGPFDLIIDDGGHTMRQHQISFETLWPHVAPGGFYGIEDLHTAYRLRFGGGDQSSASTVEWLKRMVDALNGVEQNPKRWTRIRNRLLRRPDGALPPGWERVAAVLFYPSLALIQAKEPSV